MSSGIRQVVNIAARILQVRRLAAGDPVGYGATYVCQIPSLIATAAMGYADGYLRSFAGQGSVFIDDIPLKVVGRVSMDLITIDATEYPAIAEGDWITLPYDLPKLSSQSGLSQYELLTGLGLRSERIWR